jgi:Terminase small subunit
MGFMNKENTSNDNANLLIDDKISKKKRQQRQSKANVKLTSQQSMFISQYVKTANLEESAIYAGYSAKNAIGVGKQLLASSKVQRVLDSYRIQVSKTDIVSYEHVLNVLKSHLDCADREVSIRAASEINKMKGYYAPTKSVNLNLDLTVETFEQLDISLEDY